MAMTQVTLGEPMRLVRLNLLCAAGVMLSVCLGAGAAEPKKEKATIAATGTVVHVNLEGGFWGIQGDDGKKYDPGSSLPAEYRKEGLRVKFEAEEVKGVFTIRMWGTVVRILKIEKIEKK